MADCRCFQKFVRNAPRGASGVFFFTNFLLVKHFSKTGQPKTGDRVEGWKDLFLQWFFWVVGCALKEFGVGALAARNPPYILGVGADAGCNPPYGVTLWVSAG
jgi:hypothetical protein